MLLNLDPELSRKIGELYQRTALDFILGKKDISEWDSFVNNWMEAGGQKLLDSAAEQLGVEKY